MIEIIALKISVCVLLTYSNWETPSGVVANVLNCDILGSEIKILMRYYVHFPTNILGIGMNLLILSTPLNRTTIVFFFSKMALALNG